MTTTIPALRIARTFKATPQEVFAAWTQPELLACWFAPGALEAEVLELDAVEGGAYRIRMHDPNRETHTVSGRFVEVAVAERLVMTWQWEEDGAYESRVTVTFEGQEEDARTEVVVLHEGLRDEAAIENHSRGWNGCLDKLPCRQVS